MIKRVSYKLPGTRKVREWVVYPGRGTQSSIEIQCDDAVARFDPVTGCGIYAVNAGGAYFVHLAMPSKRRFHEFPVDFVQQCIDAQPKSGDTIGNGVVKIV